VLLGEPPPTSYDLNFRVGPIPVRVHPLFWLVAAAMGLSMPGAAGLLAWVAAVFVAVLLHELGHALAMRACGFHSSIMLYWLGGLTSQHSAGFQGSRGSGTLAQVFIAAAGPGAGFLVAALLVACLRLGGQRVELEWNGWFDLDIYVGLIGSRPGTYFVDSLLFVSIYWGIINLLPVYPLDGGQIAREVLVATSRDGLRQSLALSAIAGAAMAVVGVMELRSIYVGLFFGYLAYASLVTWQSIWPGKKF